MNTETTFPKIKFKNSSRKRNYRTNNNKDLQCEKSDDETSTVVKVPKVPSNSTKLTIHKTKSYPKNIGSENDDQPITSINYSSGEVRDLRQLATACNEVDTEIDRDSKALYEKHLQQSKDGTTNDGLYHGLSAYKSYIEKKGTSFGNASSSSVRQGPVRASQNIRVTTRWDYHPELCKDYNETGFCGFGDSCKFLHDRTDYKAGWEIEKEYEEGKQQTDEHNYEIHDHQNHDHHYHDLDNLPLTCPVCNNQYNNPVKTKCDHYFCEKCALSHYQTTGRCFLCNVQTYGIFNPATDLMKKIEKLEEKRKAAELSEDENFDPDDLLEIGENSKDIVNECNNGAESDDSSQSESSNTD